MTANNAANTRGEAMKSAARRIGRNSWLIGLVGAALLAACGERDVILPGERESLRAVLSDAEEAAIDTIPENRTVALKAGRVTTNANWTQRHGTPSTRTDHPAFGGAMQMLWAADIGAGNSRRNRITADPVVAGGRIFTLDAEARVSATGTDGNPVWSTNLLPPNDKAHDATGGGLAYADGKLFVSSGFGLMTALDAASGAQLWQQKLDATGSGAPTVAGNTVYLVAGDNTAWALNAENGRIRWQLDATPSKNNILGAPAPALNGQVAIFGFGSGELQAAFRGGGLRLWDSLISGQRAGFARASVTDITGDPVISGNTVYAGSQSGRMVALNAGTGERIWTAKEGPMSPVWVAGDSVFLVSDRNELVRLAAADGTRIWGTKLSHFAKDRPRRQKTLFAHYGPVLAGGRLIVASGDGYVRAFDPTSGNEVGRAEIPGGASANPVFAGGIMYVVGAKGQLFAFR